MEKVKNKRFYFPVGQKSYPVRELKVDNKGLHFIGYVYDSESKKPIMDTWYEDIQKCERSCDIRTLFENAVKNDNMDLLKIRQKVSADVSNLPDNLLDMLNAVKSAESYFNSLPVEIKKDFNNNSFEFIKRQGKFSQEYIDNFNTKLNLQLQNDKNLKVDNDVKKVDKVGE